MLTASRSRMSTILARLPPYSGIMLSTSSTSAPRATSRRAMAEPIRPKPPVITARTPVYTSRPEFTLPRHRTPQGDLGSPWVITAALRDWSPLNVTDNVTSLGPIPGGPIGFRQFTSYFAGNLQARIDTSTSALASEVGLLCEYSNFIIDGAA